MAKQRSMVSFATHHIDEAVALSDRVVVFTAWSGRAIFCAQMRKVCMELTAHLKDEVH
jgi:ABC-type nitrate/sulfonate/bicarbonate transport system ATPase subunit